ncbi:MAG: B3/4 domain-containing protein [Streptococcaceae bacterium]|jgi:DNA/RNA-binding domain of Phe-tRNA-synthetase-like protein|nr:B3/4 domain-containing protein [Streptococcaceae bacterium]
MAKFIVTQEFWELFPDAHFGIVLAKGLDNSGESSAEIKRTLNAANEASEEFTDAAVFSENPAVAVWRAAYQKFKTKKGARSSVENLLKRVSKGNNIRSINPLVDLYNSISLSYGLPAGGEDLDSFVGDMRLTLAKGGEDFIGIGEDHSEPCLPGEMAYLDDSGAVCRGWNWRDGQRTMLTAETKNAFLIVESCVAEQEKSVIAGTSELSSLVNKHFGLDTVPIIIDKEHPEAEL